LKRNKIILTVLILSMIVLIFSGCGVSGGGNPATPPTSDNHDDSNIPEPAEAISQKIDLSIGGTVEVTDPESPIVGAKLIIPPMSSNKDGKDSIANITISYLDNPYAIELPDNQGFLRTPLTISSDITLDIDCILEIPYTEDHLSNAGASSNETVNVYRYSYTSSSWEKITINKKIHKDTSDIIEIIFRPEDIDSPYACTILDAYPPSDLGLPQPGDLLYKLGSILPWEKEAKGWRPGHVGIYVGELVYDGVIYYNVIEALNEGVQRSYYNPISKFSGSATYMGARQPESGALTSKQREDVVWYVKDKIGIKYAWGQSAGILFGMLRGNLVKEALGTYNCVGLAEAAYEYAGINGGKGLVSDWAEGNYCPTSKYSLLCILTPAEQYNKTVPAEGYNEEIPDISGNWSGNYSTNLISGSINFVNITQSGINFSGTYNDSLGTIGTISGEYNGNAFDFTMTQTNSTCSGSFNGTAYINGNTLTFTFTGYNCLGTHENGTGTLTR